MQACRQCQEAGFPVTSSAVFSGCQSAKIMIVGQAPGISEQETGRPFNGPSGTRLFDWLSQAGLDEASFRALQYMTAVTKCYPGRSPSGKGDRAPSRAEQKLCAGFLEQEVALVQPEILIPVGSMAVRTFMGSVRLADVVGNIFPQQNRFIVPLPHPSGVNLWLNRSDNQERVTRALQGLRELRQRREL